MFAEYDYSLYETNSIVKIKLNKKIEDNKDFDDFLNKWLELYEREKDFIFIFDTSDVGFIPIKYSIQMSLFIKKLKKREYHYLQKSIIFVKLFFATQNLAPAFLTLLLSSVNSDVFNPK